MSIQPVMMKDFNPQAEIPPRLLATDLDGTLIPLPANEANRRDLSLISAARKRSGFGFIFATGRHFDSVQDAIRDYGLPLPDWIICDVGTGIHRHTEDGFEPFAPYQAHLTERTGGSDRSIIDELLKDLGGLQPQPSEHQREFKISYQSEAAGVEALTDSVNRRIVEAELPYTCMGSVDPFLNIGLLDILPKDVSKAYALIWLATHADFKPDEVVYAGDSGNDLAALVSGFRAIVVANAGAGLADQVESALAARNLSDRLYRAEAEATSGVLEGCRHFGLIPS